MKSMIFVFLLQIYVAVSLIIISRAIINAPIRTITREEAVKIIEEKGK